VQREEIVHTVHLSGFDALRKFQKHPNGAVYRSAPVEAMALKSLLGIVQLLSYS